MDLSHYHVHPVTGFVPPVPLPHHLPASYAVWDALVPEMSALIRARRLRAALRALPMLDIGELVLEGDRERALLLLTHFANGYVWSGDSADLQLPATVAVPLCALAAEMGRQPIAHYATTTLTNWRLVDPTQPVSVDNARTQIQFLGGVDEDWFFIASMGVELAGAPLLPVVADALQASRDGSDAELTRALEQFTHGMAGVQAALEHVRTWCDPATYYLRVRPFVAGWPQPGVVYEGVSDEPRRFIGGSAAQSALLQLFDAMLGVHHADAPAGAYLRAVRGYMPPPHRTFVEDAERDTRVRERVVGGTPALQQGYNEALATIATFREAHMRLAHDYIVAPSGATRDMAGTGGTALDSFLRGAHRSTSNAHV
ncbi:hypothetical protein [Gemmatimonas phototrophica]|uniref:Indoleamine 2,3-dioxygenase n=1 Tax=Gemmatimonas phototrophica TaxID=1379270 RepID=A0A143BNJ1_9BACT|nr:hypothetical protein [Gemmatimonas phototrophica]AMW05994.1 hypothetical protein GEMMAAP_16770 [Gemmatimonas phototrophica]